MQRGSDRLNVHQDDEMKHQLQGMLRSGHSTRAEEWNDPEPGADDDPAVTTGPEPRLRDEDQEELRDEGLRFELARYLGRTPFPAERQDLLNVLDERHAPAELVDIASSLPGGDTYRNVQEVMTALGHRPRS
ncbi:DUF2795 domain-containing protein [Streptomyces sp. TP-A0874]|uniref:DUF2795 domain-containing protein n=1 Tax=Streptomyces sp. TP-A0874 TaxID=549819 RepID=UPI00085399A2|nr:DUF2795 domain-containing protein [Streptomyces sp. TP-A0874]